MRVLLTKTWVGHIRTWRSHLCLEKFHRIRSALIRLPLSTGITGKNLPHRFLFGRGWARVIISSSTEPMVQTFTLSKNLFWTLKPPSTARCRASIPKTSQKFITRWWTASHSVSPKKTSTNNRIYNEQIKWIGFDQTQPEVKMIVANSFNFFNI